MNDLRKKEQRFIEPTGDGQVTVWEKIFATHISNKRLLSRIYKNKQTKPCITIKYNSPTKNKIGERFEQILDKRRCR